MDIASQIKNDSTPRRIAPTVVHTYPPRRVGAPYPLEPVVKKYEFCPECNDMLVHIEGCKRCMSCGYSACGK